VNRLLLSVLVVLASASSASAGILLIEDQGGFGGAAAVLTSDGHSVTVVNNNFATGYSSLLNQGFLSQFNLVVYGERGNGSGSVLPANVAASLETYIQSGGHLLVTGYDTLGHPTDANLAALVRACAPGDRVSYDGTWQTSGIDHPILNGPHGDFRNQTFEATGYDDDLLTPKLTEGAIALATIPGVTSRIIFTDLPGTGGSVGYWNGGESGITTNAQPDFSDGGNPEGIFRNWAAFADGGRMQNPEPATLTMWGLGAAGYAVWSLRRRRRACA
jgi:hypothetical protein